MERLGSVLEASWERLGLSWTLLGSLADFQTIGSRLEGVVGASWRGLGSSWTRLGDAWEASWGVLGVFFSVFETSLKRIARKLDF